MNYIHPYIPRLILTTKRLLVWFFPTGQQPFNLRRLIDKTLSSWVANNRACQQESSKVSGNKIFMHRREYYDFLRKFCFLTVPKNLIGETLPSIVEKKFGMENFYRQKGGITIFRRRGSISQYQKISWGNSSCSQKTTVIEIFNE